MHTKNVICDPKLVMDRDQNLRELSVSVISRFTIYGICEIHECPFSLFFVIVSENLANCGMISREIAKIIGIGREQDFTFKNFRKT